MPTEVALGSDKATLLMVAVPDEAPRFNVVAAPKALTVVAVVLIKLKVVWLVVKSPPLISASPARVRVPKESRILEEEKNWILPVAPELRVRVPDPLAAIVKVELVAVAEMVGLVPDSWMVASARTRLALASRVRLPEVFETVAAVPERERVMAPLSAARAMVPSVALEILSAFLKEISLVKVPEKLRPVVIVPPAVSMMLMALVMLPPELVISMASLIPEEAAESIFRALSTTVVPAAVVSNC